MTPPTARQLDVLRFVVSHRARHGAPPSQWEICNKFGFSSPNGAFTHLSALRRKGLITRSERGLSRAYAVTVAGYEALGVASRGISEVAAREITGTIDPPSMRCLNCARALFGRSHEQHVCHPEDVESVRGAA